MAHRSCLVPILAVLSLASAAFAQPPARTDVHGDPLPAGAMVRLGSLRFRSAAEIKVVAFSPDGKTLATGGVDRAITFWDPETGRELRRFIGHGEAVTSLVFSPDGKSLASGGYDQTVRLWDLASGKEVRQLKADGIWVTSLAFSRDGSKLAAGTRARQVYVWEVENGKELHRLVGHSLWATSVVFSADGKKLFSGGKDRTIRVWDVASGEQAQQWEGQRRMIYALALSPDGRHLAAGGSDFTVRLRDIGTGEEVQKLEGHTGSVYTVTFSADGKLLATGGRDGTVRLWDLAEGKLLHTAMAGGEEVVSLAFAPDGRTLASINRSQVVRLWKTATGEELRSHKGHGGSVVAVAFTPDGKGVVSSGQDRALRVWDLGTSDERLKMQSHTRPALNFAFAPDGRTFASSAEDQTVRIWDLAKGTLLHDYAQQAHLVDIAYSTDGEAYVWVTGPSAQDPMRQRFGGWSPPSATYDLRRIDLATGKTRKTFQSEVKQQLRPQPGVMTPFLYEGHSDRISCVAVAEARALVATGSLDKSIVVWDAAQTKFIARIAGHEAWLTALAFSPDGRALASGASDGTIRLWEVATRRPALWQQGALPDVKGEVSALRFSPDGRFLAWAAGNDNTVHLWDLTSGRARPSFTGHRDRVLSLAFSADGRRLVSGSADTTVLVWDVAGAKDSEKSEPPEIRDPDQLWASLARDDAATAYEGMWALTADPEKGLAFLKKRVRIQPGKEKTAAERVADLDSNDFKARREATDALEAMGELARADLAKVLGGKPSLEVRKRIETILQVLDRRRGLLSPEELRQLRTVQALEWIGTPEARRFLDAISRGSPLLWQTHEAKAAVQRLAKFPTE